LAAHHRNTLACIVITRQNLAVSAAFAAFMHYIINSSKLIRMHCKDFISQCITIVKKNMAMVHHL